MMDFFYAQLLDFIVITQLDVTSSVFFEAIAEKSRSVGSIEK